jgi:hypothetical protein
VNEIPKRYPSFTFEPNGSMRTPRAMRLVSDPTTPAARAIAAEVERQNAIVERAVQALGWPLVAAGTKRESP